MTLLEARRPALDPAWTIDQTDYFRRSPKRLGGTGPFKEWQHFIAHTDDLHLLVNFNVLDDAFRESGPETGRVIVLARARSGWTGEAVRVEPHELEVKAGRIRARFGPNELDFVDGKYRVRLRLEQPRIVADLEFVPHSIPALCPNQPLSRDETLSWLFVPRLVANGWAEIEGTTFDLSNAPAYHDHNWGRFRWGDDFTWEWSSVLPERADCPWSAVYMRLTDRARTTARCQGLYLWHGMTHRRIFRDHEISVHMEGAFEPKELKRIPAVMSLLAPGRANDVPERMIIRARGDGDDVTLTFRMNDLCQVVVPSERDFESVVALNEATGEAQLSGRVADETFEMKGPGVFEFIRA